MIKIENTDVYGWDATIRGMRNPLNSWDKSDTLLAELGVYGCDDCVHRYEDCAEFLQVNNGCLKLGENDLKLMKNLSKAGNDHGKFLRMINVTMDITAPLYWWKEFDAYKVGTVANSCSTMHKIHAKEFELDDFSLDKLCDIPDCVYDTIDTLNVYREEYLKTKDKRCWWYLIQLLPSSYNQKRTVQLNYQVLKQMYFARKNHKLDEWHTFCEWCETLPYFKEICIDIYDKE